MLHDELKPPIQTQEVDVLTTEEFTTDDASQFANELRSAIQEKLDKGYVFVALIPDAGRDETWHAPNIEWGESGGHSTYTPFSALIFTRTRSLAAYDETLYNQNIEKR